MKLLNIERHSAEAVCSQTLDQLWQEAASLGGVRLWQYAIGHDIEVTIVFTRRSGTKVEAKGRNTNVAFALADAINEAREMGAGVAQ